MAKVAKPKVTATNSGPANEESLANVAPRRSNRKKSAHPGPANAPAPRRTKKQKAEDDRLAKEAAEQVQKRIDADIRKIRDVAKEQAAAHAREITPPPFSEQEARHFSELRKRPLPDITDSELSELPSEDEAQGSFEPEEDRPPNPHQQEREASEQPSDQERTVKRKGKGKLRPNEAFRQLDEEEAANAHGDGEDAMQVDGAEENHQWLHARDGSEARSSNKRSRESREPSVDPEETPLRPPSKKAKQAQAEMIPQSEPEEYDDDSAHRRRVRKGKQKATDPQTPTRDEQDAEDIALASGMEDISINDPQDQDEEYIQQAQPREDFDADDEDEEEDGQQQRYEQQHGEIQEYESDGADDKQDHTDRSQQKHSNGTRYRGHHEGSEGEYFDFTPLDNVPGSESDEESIRPDKSQRKAQKPPQVKSGGQSGGTSKSQKPTSIPEERSRHPNEEASDDASDQHQRARRTIDAVEARRQPASQSSSGQPKISQWRTDVPPNAKPGSVRTIESAPSLTSQTTRSSTSRSSTSRSSRSALTNNVQVRVHGHDDDDDGMGGFSDHEERRGGERTYAVNSPLKNGQRVRNNNIIQWERTERDMILGIINDGWVPDELPTSGRPATKHLHPAVKEAWPKILSHLYKWYACQHNPWAIEDVTLIEVLNILLKEFVNDSHWISERVNVGRKSHIFKVATYRLSDGWRATFGSTAIWILAAFFDGNPHFGDSNTKRREYCRYLLENNRFIFGITDDDDDGGYYGMFRGEVVTRTLAHHIYATAGATLMRKLPASTNDTLGRSAIAMAAIAAERALTLWAHGAITVENIRNAQAMNSKAITFVTKKILKDIGSAFSQTHWGHDTTCYLHSLYHKVTEDDVRSVVKDAQDRAVQTGLGNGKKGSLTSTIIDYTDFFVNPPTSVTLNHRANLTEGKRPPNLAVTPAKGWATLPDHIRELANSPAMSKNVAAQTRRKRLQQAAVPGNARSSKKQASHTKRSTHPLRQSHCERSPSSPPRQRQRERSASPPRQRQRQRERSPSPPPRRHRRDRSASPPPRQRQRERSASPLPRQHRRERSPSPLPRQHRHERSASPPPRQRQRERSASPLPRQYHDDGFPSPPPRQRQPVRSPSPPAPKPHRASSMRPQQSQRPKTNQMTQPPQAARKDARKEVPQTRHQQEQDRRHQQPPQQYDPRRHGQSSSSSQGQKAQSAQGGRPRSQGEPSRHR